MEKSGVLEAFPSGLDTSKPPKRAERQKWWKIGGKDVSHVSVDDGYEVDSETSSLDGSSGLVKNVNNVFVAPEAVEIYKPIAGFEGTHRFDPSAVWTEEEEKTLVRTVC